MATKDFRFNKNYEDQKSQKFDNKDPLRRIMSEESSDIQAKVQKKAGAQRSYVRQQEQEQDNLRNRNNRTQSSSQRIQSQRYQQKQQQEEDQKIHHQGSQSQRFSQQDNIETCQNHGKPFSDYCETCEEPCCEDCNNYGHRVVPISEAYRKRMSQMYSMMNSSLSQKKELLVQQIRKREENIDEVREAALSIERELRAEFAGMNERLNAKAGQKLALLQYDRDDLQSDVNQIQDIAMQLDQISSDHLQFLIKSKDIMESMENVLAKPFKNEVQVNVDDLPNELMETRDLIQQCALYKQLNEMKDELIWRILVAHKNSTEISPTAQEEINQWVKITDKFKEALEQFNLKCVYCSQLLDSHSVNTVCEKNTSIDIHQNFPQHLTGNGRHNFLEISKATPLQMDEILKEIRHISSSLNINLEVMFKDFDKTLCGYIDIQDFCYLMFQYFSVSQQQAEMIADNLYPEQSKTHLVDYNAFLRKIYLTTTKPLQNENQQISSDQEPFQEQNESKDLQEQRSKKSDYFQKSPIRYQRTKEENVKKSRYDDIQPRQKDIKTQDKDQNQQKSRQTITQDLSVSQERRRKINEEETSKTKNKSNPEEIFEKKLQERFLSKEKMFKQEIQIFIDEEGICSVENLKVALYKTGLGLTNQEIIKASQMIPAKDGRISFKEFVNLFH